MATYRELISNKDFLKVMKRANNIGAVNFSEVKYYNKELVFFVPSETGNGAYSVRVVVKDLDRRKTKTMSAGDINTAIRASNLLVSCTCPAYKYWGFKYISTLDGYGLTVEHRHPFVRNPQLRGYVCKHIYRALQLYPFMTNEIRKALVHG